MKNNTKNTPVLIFMLCANGFLKNNFIFRNKLFYADESVEKPDCDAYNWLEIAAGLNSIYVEI